MKFVKLLLIITSGLFATQMLAANRYWVSDTTGNWNNTLNWATSNNGTPGASVPSISDKVYFNGSGIGNCDIDTTISIDGIITTGYPGAIDLKGFSFNIAASGTSSSNLSEGEFKNTGAASSITGTTTGEIIFSGTTFNVPINVVAGRIRFSGGIFNQPVTVEDNGGASTNGAGGCVFNSTLHVTNSGTSYFLMGHNLPDVFNDDIYLINNSTSRIRMAYNSANNEFNGNIYVSSSLGSGVYICESGGSASLADSKVISTFGAGFTVGELRLKNFNQIGITPQNITLTGTALFRLETGSIINAPLTVNAPRLLISGTLLKSTADLTKTGTGDNYSAGGNTFKQNVVLTNTGTGSFIMNNTSGDTYEGNLILNNQGGKHIYLAYNGTTTTVFGDLTVNNTGSGSSNTVMLADQTSSILNINGNVVINNNSTSSSNIIYLGNRGDVTIGGTLIVNNSSTGNSNDIYIGNNSSSLVKITGNTVLNNSGTASNTRIYAGNAGSVNFNGELEINNTSSSNNCDIQLNRQSTSSNTYKENITLVASSLTSDGIRFGSGGGSGTLYASKTISIGAGGFKGGYLTINNFIQTGNTAQSLTTTNNSLLYLENSNFGGNIELTAPRINIKNNAFAGVSTFHKTGASDDASHGGNSFMGNCTFNNSGSGYFLTGNSASDSFGANLTLNNTGSKHIYIAHNSAGNTIAGSLTVNNNASAAATTEVHVASETNGTINIGGATILNNIGSSTAGNIYFGRKGSINVNNSLTINNHTTGANGHIIVAGSSSSSIEISGTTSVSNTGSGTTKRVYLGQYGDVIFQNDLAINNSSNANNSEVYLNHETSSINQYNGNITVASTIVGCDGVRFGDRDGSGTLAATKSISLGGLFISGQLNFRNFTHTGTLAVSLPTTGNTQSTIRESQFGGNFNIQAGRISIQNSTFSGTTLFEKTGASDDVSYGGNTFTGNSEIKNSGSGYFLLGLTAPDHFGGNLLVNNIGSKHIYIAHRSPGNTVAGSLTVNNNCSSNSTTEVYFASDSAGSITIDGPTVLNNIGSSNSGNIYFGRHGDVTLNNNLTINNNTTGNNGQVLVAKETYSTVSINGTTNATNNGSGTTKRIYFGENGDITFQNDLTIDNTSNATNSEVFLNHKTNSSNQYNGNITVSSTVAGCDGIKFGEDNGTGVLKATKTISIGTSFVSGYLNFRNFTQLGSALVSLPTTGTTYSLIKESQFGGNFSIQAPRLYLKNSTFSGNANFEKTGGIGDDYSYGGNTVQGLTTIINSGSKTFSFGSTVKDIFNDNVTISNTGTNRIFFARSTSGNVVNGDLTINNSATGTGSNYIYVADNSISSLNVSGNTTLTNNSSSVQSYIHLGVSGDITIGGNLNITNTASGTHSAVSIATNSDSKVIINGNTTAINNNNASKQNRLFFANNGDIDFHGTVLISNNAGSQESEVFLHHGSTASINFFNNITISSNHLTCDGFYFGERGGTGVLANGKSISILGNNSANFIGGDLRFYNFTQIGATPHTFKLAPSARYILNSSNSWGGNTSFTAPRIYTKTSTFSGDAYFEKTGKDHDDSPGGNVYSGDFTYNHHNNISSGRTYLAASNPNTFNGDVTIENTGAFSDVLLGNSNGTYTIDGDVNLYNLSTGTGSQHVYLSNKTSAIFNIAGDLNVYNESPSNSTNYHNTYISNHGNVNISGNANLQNIGTDGKYKYIYFGNSGNVSVGGDLIINNRSTATNTGVLCASGSTSHVTISGNTSVLNTGSKNQNRIYLGYNGDMTFTGDVNAGNFSSATNSEIYFNSRATSTCQFNGNISISSNHSNCDGFLFGAEGGTANLANTKTISIPGGSAFFIGGQVYFRNFNQAGNTPQTLELGSTASYIFNYNSNWGGNVNFAAPRIRLRQSTFAGTATIEKTGASDDASYGGNTFSQNTILTNSGSGYLLTGNNLPDNFNSNLTLNNTGSHHIYIAHNTTGNQVAGNLVLNQSTSGSSSSIRLASRNTANLTVSGNITVSNTSSANNSAIYIGEGGDITCNGNLNITNNPSGATTNLYVAANSSSAVTITGNTSVINNGASTTKRIYLGNNGDITFNGTLAITNNATATNSEIFLNHSSASANIYKQNITLATSGLTCDGIRFGQSNGSGTLASGKTISIGGTGFNAGELQLRNFNQLGSTAQNLTLSGNSLLNILYSQWNGNVTFQSPRILLAHTIYNGPAFIEKTGASNDASTGGNTFNGETTLKNSGVAYFMPANRTGNDFNGNVTYIKSNSGLLYPSYDAESTYAGNITSNTNTTVRFAAASRGKITLDGTIAQSISTVGSIPEFRYLKSNKASNHTTLNNPIKVTYRLDLISGNINTDATNIINMTDNSLALNASSSSFVDGPVLKTGNDTFVFPTGGNGTYAPIGMSNPRSSSEQFQANYFAASTQANGFDTTAISSGLDHISNSEYWTLNRVSGSSNVKTTLHWNTDRSGNIGVGSACNVRVARWNGTRWVNEGNGGTTGNAVNGSVVSGTSENCSTPTNVTSWTNNYPFTLAVDSNYITWDGLAFDGGSGAGSAPSVADAGRILKVYAPDAVLPSDAKVAHVIITEMGKLNIPTGTILEVSGTIVNNGELIIENNGSLVQTIAGADRNSGIGTYKVNRTGGNSTYSYNIWSSPLKSAALTSVFSSSNPCDIWAFDENNQAWSHDFAVGYTTSCYGNSVTFAANEVIAGGDGTMDIGRGYFVPGATVTTRAFSGDVNNGDITVPVVTTSLGHQTNWDNDDWNLVGNPYPSGLDATKFLRENAIDNARINGALYFWDAGDTTGGYNQHSDYASYSGLGGVNSGNTAEIPNGNIASGQGFWVYAQTNTNIVFDNSMRNGLNNQFFKSGPSENHNVWVSFTNPSNYTNNILLGYNTESTDAEDAGLDAHKLEGSSNVRFSSLINTDEYSIQAFEELQLGESKSIPLLTFSADSGMHTFSKYHSENLPTDLIVYIKDNDLGTTHNFDDGDYSVNLDAGITYNSRFEIVFEKTIELADGGNGSKGIGEPTNDTIDLVTGLDNNTLENKFTLATLPNGYQLSNENGITGNLLLMDVTGKIIWTSSTLDGVQSFRIPTDELSQGIYFIELINENERRYTNKILKQ